jgi:hypothetical protein
MSTPSRAPSAVRTERGYSLSTSTIGARALVSVFSSSWNRGVSAMASRIHRPTAISAPLSRNGTRQPHDSKDASERVADMIPSTPAASRLPTGTPTCGQLAFQPRRLESPCSIDISTAPPHSPPSPRPWEMRSTTSRMGAATPMAAYVGSRPIRKVAMPITSRVTTSTFLRPTLSP